MNETETTQAQPGQQEEYAATSFSLDNLGITPGEEARQERIQQFLANAPADYKDREWVQNIARADNPHLELFKGYENAQKLIGDPSRQGVKMPADDAPAEKWAEFYKSIGAPETADAYHYEPIKLEGEDQQLSDYLNATRNADMMNSMKTAALKAGITPKQFQALVQTYDQTFIQQNKDAIKQLQQVDSELNGEFDNLSTQWFGARKDAVMANGRALIEKFAPQHARAHLETLDNKALLILASVLDGVSQRYIKEDTSFTTSQSASPALSMQQIRDEGMKLMATEAYSNPLHPEHEAMVRKVRENYARQSSVPR